MSPIEETNKEVLAAVLYFGSKKEASKRLKLPQQTITKLINETFPGGRSGDASRGARVKFDQKFLKFSPAVKRDISQFATGLRKLMSPKDIQKIKDNVDDYAGQQRFKKILKALRRSYAKGYGVRLTTYQNPNRISLQVHKPKQHRKPTNKRNRKNTKQIRRKTKTSKKKKQEKVIRKRETIKRKSTKKQATKAKRQTSTKSKTVSRNRRRSSKR